MSRKTLAYILVGIAFVLVVVALLVYDAKTDTRTLEFYWDQYDIEANPDVTVLTIYEVQLFVSDTLKADVIAQVDPAVSSYTYSTDFEQRLYYFAMTATDSVGNESGLSNIVSLDLETPLPVAGFGVRIVNN